MCNPFFMMSLPVIKGLLTGRSPFFHWGAQFYLIIWKLFPPPVEAGKAQTVVEK